MADGLRYTGSVGTGFGKVDAVLAGEGPAVKSWPMGMKSKRAYGHSHAEQQIKAPKPCRHQVAHRPKTDRSNPA